MKKIILTFLVTTVFFVQTGKQVQAQTQQQTATTKVIIHTGYGDIILKLYNETPLHRDNFIKLIKEKQLDSTLFHRVIKAFMIQGGDPSSKQATKGSLLGNGGPGYTIPAEFKKTLYHKKGALAAARESDLVNPVKASSGSQFYIVQGKIWTVQELDLFAKRLSKTFSPEQVKTYTTIGGTPHLDDNYTVFGEIISGFDVLDKIAAVPCDNNNRPLIDIPMTVTLK